MTRLRLISATGLAVAVASGLAAQSRPLQPLLVVRLDSGSQSGDARPVWSGDPSMPSAGTGLGQPQPLMPLPVTRLEEPGASVTLDAVRPLSMRFAEPLPIRDVLLLLVRGTGLSLVTEPGLEGTFIGELSGVTLRQALDLVITAQGLDYEVEGAVIRVIRRRTATRFFDLNVAVTQREGQGSLIASTSPSGDGANGSQASVTWKNSGDAFEDIAAGVRALLSADGRFALDRRAGVVQVTDYPDRLDRVGIYVETIERRLRRQVEIEARVVEVTLSDSSATRVDWTAAFARARTAPAAGAVAPIDFEALIDALDEQGDVAVLASPRVPALHNEPALLRIGLQNVTFERANDRERTAAPLEGLTLAVTPHITADGVVFMSVSPSVTQRVGQTGSRDRRTAVMAVNELSTAARLRDGETLVLSGLRRSRDQQPETSTGLAALFRRQTAQKPRSELAVLLTARVKG
ncbi:MAG TPA: hypothetical protein VK886_21090 [Vicinamibacterales bacterium]|nr:hypothetical protein [Vicinamibacterales bacterium]